MGWGEGVGWGEEKPRGEEINNRSAHPVDLAKSKASPPSSPAEARKSIEPPNATSAGTSSFAAILKKKTAVKKK